MTDPPPLRLVKTAHVFVGRERAATIERTLHGSVVRYERDFLDAHRATSRAIGFNLPLTEEPIVTTGVNLHPFFANLLPEGLRLQSLIYRVKTSPDDLLTLLMAAGPDSVGDVCVTASHHELSDTSASADFSKPETLDFEELYEQSLSYSERAAGGSSVPGVQQKISGAMISFPVRGRGHRAANILKLNPPDLPRLVENEAFFMRAAAASEIDVARVRVIHDSHRRSGLLVERFDRAPDDGVLRKLHQEDACQLLDRYPADKYSLSCGQIAEALGVCTAPIVQVARFVELVAFSYLVGNGDLHAKNVSVIVRSNGRVDLSPAYDLLSTLPYGDQHMALQLDGRDRNLKRQHIALFAERHGVRPKATTRMLDRLCSRMPTWIDGLEEIGLDQKKTRHLRSAITARARDLS